LKGFRGATGTQASYLSLCSDDGDRVDELEAAIVRRILGESAQAQEDAGKLGAQIAASVGFTGEAAEFLEAAMKHGSTASGYLRNNTHTLVTQNYPRVYDAFVLSDLASTAAVLHKIATDIRLLCNRKEIDEPFEDKQIGSSAMPYKRNPMRCERICGLTRFVMNLVGNAYDTAATQWLERTLDDSSNRRLSLPEAFLALDGALDLMHNVASGLIVHEAMVRKNLMAELPFMATENILMECVKLGGDRQHYHELIRQHAQAAGLRVKQEGLDNDLLERLQRDPAFHPPALKTELDWSNLMDPMKYVGRSVEQTERFITEVVEPLRAAYGDAIAKLETSGPRV
jgi:adenylosuccinate lyase